MEKTAKNDLSDQEWAQQQANEGIQSANDFYEMQKDQFQKVAEVVQKLSERDKDRSITVEELNILKNKDRILRSIALAFTIEFNDLSGLTRRTPFGSAKFSRLYEHQRSFFEATSHIFNALLSIHNEGGIFTVEEDLPKNVKQGRFRRSTGITRESLRDFIPGHGDLVTLATQITRSEGCAFKLLYRYKTMRFEVHERGSLFEQEQ